MFKNKPFDDDFCFMIQDFHSGDSIIVKGPKKQKIKGVVDSVDKRTNEIIYHIKDKSIHRTNLNYIAYLDDPKSEWLDE